MGKFGPHKLFKVYLKLFYTFVNHPKVQVDEYFTLPYGVFDIYLLDIWREKKKVTLYRAKNGEHTFHKVS